VVPVLGHTCLVKKQSRALSPQLAAVSLNLFCSPQGIILTMQLVVQYAFVFIC
jgi:hypothetical protein